MTTPKHIALLTLILSMGCGHKQPVTQSLIQAPLKTQQKPHTSSNWPDAHHFVVEFQVDDKYGELVIGTGEGSTDYAVDWNNDGIFDEYNLTGEARHHYGKPGIYTVRLMGEVPHIQLCTRALDETSHTVLKQQVLDIAQWGAIRWKSMQSMFAHCNVLTTWSASDHPILTEVTHMSHMFQGSTAFNQPLNHWDTSHVTHMDFMFFDASAFNQPLNAWDTSQVTTMRSMFHNATTFNQPLDTWNTSRVTTMFGMFLKASVFNQPLNTWNTAQVTTMAAMFLDATAFDQPLAQWDVSKVERMDGMFYQATSFNQPLNNWKTKSIRNINGIFANARQFNQPLDQWDTSKVTIAEFMFAGAQAFNQSLASWDVSRVQTMEHALSGSAISAENYDATLQAWSKLPEIQEGVKLGAEGLNYCYSVDGRQTLINQYKWQIEHDTFHCE